MLLLYKTACKYWWEWNEYGKCHFVYGIVELTIYLLFVPGDL